MTELDLIGKNSWYQIVTINFALFFKAFRSKKTTWSKSLTEKFKTHKTLKAAIPCLAARSGLGKIWQCPNHPVESSLPRRHF